jgi:hypothetical protein
MPPYIQTSPHPLPVSSEHDRRPLLSALSYGKTLNSKLIEIGWNALSLLKDSEFEIVVYLFFLFFHVVWWLSKTR